MIAAVALSVFCWLAAPPRAAATGAHVSAELLEAERLVAQARARGQTAGAAADVVRLAALGRWLPPGILEARLLALAGDRRLAPLVQAVAWWALYELARERLNADLAARSVAALGLLEGWQARPGPAPHPTAPLVAGEGWRPVPGPVLWLEAALRPARDTAGVAALRFESPQGGPAVLRLGFDDTAKVRLNGDEVFAGREAHPAWLDQVAIRVALRPGENLLVVEVGQEDGAWRLLARITDPAGRPLPGLRVRPDPFGPVPEPAEGAPPLEARQLFSELEVAADAEPPVAQDLRDLMDFARASGLPDREQAVARVAIERAFEVDPSPRSLLAWLEALPEAERAAVRARERPLRPIEWADVYADRQLRLADAWEHYYARRPAQTRAVLAGLLAEDPRWAPARQLEAVLLQDLGLPNRAVARLAEARTAPYTGAGLWRAHVHALRSAGRSQEAVEALGALVASGEASADARYELAGLWAQQGRTDEAVAALDGVLAAQPERLSFALEAARILAQAGREAEATARLEALHGRLEQDPVVAEGLAQRYLAQGRGAEALPLLHLALAAHPDDLRLQARIRGLSALGPPPARLGPPLAELAALPPGEGPAQVLYHHARAEVAADGRAVRQVRRVVRIQSEEGARRFAVWELPYVPGQQRLELLRARQLRPGAPEASPREGDRDLSEPEYRLYFDLRAKVLTFDRPQPGDLLEVVWQLTDTAQDPAFPGYFGELAYLQEATPRAWSVVEVGGPRLDSLQIEVVAPGLAVRREGGRVEARDVPGVPLEPQMPGASSLQAYVHVSTAAGWDVVDARYRELLGDRLQPSAALAQVARAWAGAAVGPEAILAALYTQVADRTRYVGLEFGVRSFQPATPAETLARGFGDCKDKATLLIALAAALGVEARLVLVRTRGSGQVAPAPASFALFDHAMVYVPRLDRFLDPTVDRNDPWILPPSDQGAQVLIVGEGGGLRTVPPQPAADNRLAWRARGALSADGVITGELDLRLQGQPATEARRSLEGAGDPAARLVALLGARGAALSVEGLTLSGLRPALDPVEARAQIRLPLPPAPGGGARLSLAADLQSRHAPEASRATARQIPFRYSHLEEFELGLPPGFRLRPWAPVALEGPFGAVRAEARQEGQRLRITRELILEAFEVSPADYPAFRAWLAQADRALAAPVEVGP